MKLISEYCELAEHFQRLAGQTEDAKLKQQLLDQSSAYWKLARKRASQIGVPPPFRSAPPSH